MKDASRERKPKSLEVSVELKDLEKEQKWPELAAYVFTRRGRFLAKKHLKPDAKKPTVGRAELQVEAREEELLVKIAPDVEDFKDIQRYNPAVESVKVAEKATLKFELIKPFWICWIKLPYVVTGHVVKWDNGHENPICVGEVGIYDVDIEYCILRLPDIVIERVRGGFIDIIKDPPREVEGFPPDIPWPANGDDDDGWCGTVPPKPFPPRDVDVIKKLEALPREWAFAKERFETLPTARARMDTALRAMPLPEKQVYLNADAVEGVAVSQVLYSNTAQFRSLLIKHFQAFRFWFCWYPWIHWLWWPYCGYSLEKLGTATLNPDGSFTKVVWLSICRHDKPDLWFIVRQEIGDIERVIYARHPVPCNTYWNHPNGKPVHLIVYDPNAVSCHEPPHVDIPDPYVMPMGIYEDEWHEIHQAHIAAAVNPAVPLPSNCGLYKQTDPYGTRLDLRMEFHEDLRNLLPPNNGVRYYRWSYRKHGSTNWIHINTPITHRHIISVAGHWFITAEKLGPDPVGTESDLFAVPDVDKAWLHNRNDLAYAIWYTALWDGTTGKYVPQVSDGKYDLRLEMFDKNGIKLTPAAAGFKFVLPTAAVGFVNDALFIEADGSLILHLHVDNRDTVADIQSIALGGVPTAECQFLEYSNLADMVNIKYVAYHPNDFLNYYRLAVKRGIHGTNVASMSSATAATSPTTESYTAQHLLRQIGTYGPFDQCAFAVELHTYPRTRDGHSPIRAYEDHDTSAFALVKKS